MRPRRSVSELDLSTARMIVKREQVAIGRPSYDQWTGACIGHGRPIGSPLVESGAHVDEDLRRRSDRIDRERGHSLLWITWRIVPPPSWAG